MHTYTQCTPMCDWLCVRVCKYECLDVFVRAYVFVCVCVCVRVNYCESPHAYL